MHRLSDSVVSVTSSVAMLRGTKIQSIKNDEGTLCSFLPQCDYKGVVKVGLP